MSQIEACAAVRPYAVPSPVGEASRCPPVAAGISVEIADAPRLSALQPHWRDLIRRADACNVFMHPALVCGAAQTYPDKDIRALIAWKRLGEAVELAGFWAFSVARARKSALPVNVLNSPAFPNAYVATPVIDRRLLDEVWTAMLDRLAAEPGTPKLASLESMNMDASTMEALARVVSARRSRIWVTATASRPKLASGLDAKRYLELALSGASRKKLRQHRNRLSRRGALRSTCACDPASITDAVEQFLRLEVAGWKGKTGTALLCNACDAAFTRAAMLALAREGCASIHALYLDGKPLSMQIVLRCGGAAFTWKTTYDENFRDFSPGMLLFVAARVLLRVLAWAPCAQRARPFCPHHLRPWALQRAMSRLPCGTDPRSFRRRQHSRRRIWIAAFAPTSALQISAKFNRRPGCAAAPTRRGIRPRPAALVSNSRPAEAARHRPARARSSAAAPSLPQTASRLRGRR
jgi:CelD/BcsL family acetyltransferase involved in cellulose biosynthesis